MKTIVLQARSRNSIRWLSAIIMCATLLVPGAEILLGRSVSQPVAQEAPRIPPDQLDSLVAPIALYPDPLLSQVLVASTYPLEIMQLQQWLQRNSNLKDKALADAVAKQPWDPSIQAMAPLPDVVKRLADDIQWTTDLGNAFLAQQGDVMDAIQRMRQKAQGTGALKSNQQQKVDTQLVAEGKTVIVVEQADPEVVYVPSYDPMYAYGPPVYPYPPIYYPAWAGAVGFGLGFAIGRWGGGGWGWNAGWGHNDININNNNYFNRNANIKGGDRTNVGNKWQHNPQHRGGTPYPNRSTADRFGGTARGDSLTQRQAGARQQIERQGGISDRSRTGGISDRDRAGVSDRDRAGGKDRDRASGRDRDGGRDRDRAGGRDRDGGRASGGGDRVGNRDIGRSSAGANRSAFGGGSKGFSGSSARSSSMRGSSSFGGSRGGGMRGGGGGRRR